MEKFYGVDDLLGRDDDVNHLEILFQAMPNENASGVDQITKFQVRVLQLRDEMPTRRWIQIAWYQTTESRQVIVHGLDRANVVVDYRRQLFIPVTAHD